MTHVATKSEEQAQNADTILNIAISRTNSWTNSLKKNLKHAVHVGSRTFGRVILRHLHVCVAPHDLVPRGETGSCLIKPIIQGPKGAAFPRGTASICYFIGRYGTIVLNKGDKGGREGMSSYVRDNYFAVVEKGVGDSSRWVEDSNFKVSIALVLNVVVWELTCAYCGVFQCFYHHVSRPQRL